MAWNLQVERRVEGPGMAARRLTFSMELQVEEYP